MFENRPEQEKEVVLRDTGEVIEAAERKKGV
jgi:hypothetical protein